jgi:hypothetical protein
MTTFLEFLSAAADFALTLNLKAAIVATGFIVMFCVQLVGFVLLRTILSGEAQWHRFLYARS